MPIEATEGADITLASTTETQEELDHATSENWRQPFDPSKKTPSTTDEKPAAEGKKQPAAKTEGASETPTTEVKTGKETDEDDDETPLPKGVQKRIDKLTKRLRSQEDELAALRRGEKEPSARETVTPPKAAAEADPEPKVKDFKSWEEWNAAHTRWAVRDENRKAAARALETQQNAEAKETYDSHLSRVSSYAKDHDDFEDAVKDMGKFKFANPQANMAFQFAIVEDDNGPAILHHLATHADEMAKFAGKSASQVTMMLGRLSAKLFPESAASADEKKPGETQTSKTPASKAPAPPTPVRRSTAAPATRLDDEKLSTDDFIRIRNEQERKTRRR